MERGIIQKQQPPECNCMEVAADLMFADRLSVRDYSDVVVAFCGKYDVGCVSFSAAFCKAAGTFVKKSNPVRLSM